MLWLRKKIGLSKKDDKQSDDSVVNRRRASFLAHELSYCLFVNITFDGGLVKRPFLEMEL